MLSYRHGFHAGNHADVLKHIVLVDCLQRLVLKESPLLYVDTHAGAGSYRLREGYAAMNEEWAGGIERLSAAAASEEPSPEAPPPAVGRYLSLVRGYGSSYPGSPAIAAGMLRPQDRLALFELHPSDSGPLSALFAGDGRVRVVNADGFSGLRGLLPPPSRRGLVLIDPSYELAADYDRVVEAVSTAVRRFATGVYAIWYPLLERDEARSLPGRLARLAAKSLDVSLRIRSSRPGERGMSGSGMVVLNPPWMLRETMDEVLPWLARALGEDGRAGWTVKAAPCIET
ncbi:MAG: 23S rRNA (adenine(2030)-N(6))-methyltransferase RlmJ [Spirochaetes bacterium]|nr:23S rRNA (adenine(2030)-N(6))-methyltransferase RlmJ [Spirochaetota bacterium]MBU1081168.1 23S rRNA (adenine(2030)-N(6))-methyltransferase RlmJ [Spirochaetota bacterium]